MAYVKEASVRAAALEYLRRQLADGKVLAKLLLGAVDLDVGNIATLSPAPLDLKETMQFDWGHTPLTADPSSRMIIAESPYLLVPKANSDKQLTDVIYEFLKKPEGVCFFENSLASAGDGWIERAKSRVIANGDDIYHVLLNVDRDQSKIGDAICESSAIPTFIGALGNMPSYNSARIAKSKVVTGEDFEDFAKTVRCIFVGAYDREGYVLWIGEGRLDDGAGSFEGGLR